MSDREHHCPFLNRADHRCSSFFSIERLQHAFEHCFDAYKSCGVYQELLDERQARRSQAAAGASQGAAGRFLWTTACTPPKPHVKTRFVQVRLPNLTAVDPNAGARPDRHEKPAA